MDFLMAIMASRIARGRLRTTATTATESRSMAAILQLKGWQKHLRWLRRVIIYGVARASVDNK